MPPGRDPSGTGWTSGRTYFELSRRTTFVTLPAVMLPAPAAVCAAVMASHEQIAGGERPCFPHRCAPNAPCGRRRDARRNRRSAACPRDGGALRRRRVECGLCRARGGRGDRASAALEGEAQPTAGQGPVEAAQAAAGSCWLRASRRRLAARSQRADFVISQRADLVMSRSKAVSVWDVRPLQSITLEWVARFACNIDVDQDWTRDSYEIHTRFRLQSLHVSNCKNRASLAPCSAMSGHQLQLNQNSTLLY